MKKAYLCTGPLLVLRLIWVHTRGLDVEGFLRVPVPGSLQGSAWGLVQATRPGVGGSW